MDKTTYKNFKSFSAFIDQLIGNVPTHRMYRTITIVGSKKLLRFLTDFGYTLAMCDNRLNQEIFLSNIVVMHVDKESDLTFVQHKQSEVIFELSEDLSTIRLLKDRYFLMDDGVPRLPNDLEFSKHYMPVDSVFGFDKLDIENYVEA